MDSPGDPQSNDSDEMSKADVANGERPEQPVSREQAVYERERTDKDPAGDDGGEIDPGAQSQR
jgi:hypothetical protein